MSAHNRRDFLKGAGIGSVALAMGGRPSSAKATEGKPFDRAQGKPNVVLIITDDQGYGDLACHGNKVIKTPNLDRLHADSVRLTDFHVSPVCAPTRGALMTGRWPNRVGVWHVVMGRSLLNPREVTMADVFAANGYRTGIFGKWHLGDNYPFRPQDRGFGEVLVHGGGVVGHTPDYWLNDYFDDTYLHNGKWTRAPGYCTDVWFDGAMKFIEANKNRPFFAYLPTNAPHQPFQVPPKYEAMYRHKTARPGFYGMITRIDENVARLRKHLRRLGLEDDTILIFMTDNGTVSRDFNSGMRGRKGSHYEGGHRVPCFVRWPAGGLAGGRDVKRIAAHVDILPTLIDLCGLKPPRKIAFDGASLAPLLAGRRRDWPDRTMFVELQNVVGRPVKWRRCAVMTDRWRLVNGKELYDIKADPGQRKNIARRQGQVVRKLRAEYEKWWADVSRGHGQLSEIILGSDRENPSRLTSYHWMSRVDSQASIPWCHALIVAGPHQNGYWAVKVERAGRYEITLRRWPEESGLAVNETSDARPPERPGYLRQHKPLIATRARVKIQDVDKTQPVKAGAKAVTFTADLKPGSCRLQTWFIDADNNSRGAYYVAVKRV